MEVPAPEDANVVLPPRFRKAMNSVTDWAGDDCSGTHISAGITPKSVRPGSKSVRRS